MKLGLKPHHKKRSSRQPDGPLRSRLLRFARIRERNQNRKLAVTNRYEVGMVISEILTGLLFIAGSILMFYPQMKRIPTVLYLLGSITMLLRSGLRGSYWFQFKSHKHVDSAETDSEGDWTR
ncbi:hypothetical protein AMS62_06435 [Bacillus sp. FJAT-18019]|uniref:YrhK domain-containing protein n=1 Tax=Paenibacillus solani TaxID=1705565 RepID=A0A0M1P0X7_9BACL|nr:YrhK family protein [Paenibacillus solani]KOP64925.1 hypothetical protein AMS62_06435 [Bacillus sp. FJAT-18019]KOR87764.1 hypothetical protein AM231_00475 [Paenibacillus solani]